MEAADLDFDLEDVLRLARERCPTAPPCLDCVAEATTDLILHRDLGAEALEILEEDPLASPTPRILLPPRASRLPVRLRGPA